ncbi:MAG: hypothetical protein GF355_05210 [Candidatus Eisenbacteria bacterium]|nr:hypothetical protein [Candidatus Eisenbacteria bacterium]
MKPAPHDVAAPHVGGPASGVLRALGILRVLPAVLLGTLVIAGLGCDSRDHTNPLDPGNPETGGRPEVLTALAGDGAVELHWETFAYEDLVTQTLRRSWGGDSSMVVAAGLGPGAVTWRDTDVRNGTRYTYQLAWSFSGSATPVDLPPAAARPGPAVIWATDALSGGVLRFTPDGQALLYRIGAGRHTLDLTVDPDSGIVWAADFGREEIISYHPARDELLIRPVTGVSTVSYDPVSDLLWAGSYFSESVSIHEPAGLRVGHHGGLGLVEDVEAVPGGGAYAAARGAGVWRFEADLQADPQLVLERQWPVAVAYDSVAAGVWILDRGNNELVFLPDGGEARTALAGLAEPVDLAADGEGRCWVVDGAGSAQRVAPGGGVDLTLTPPHRPAGVAVDPGRREIWLTSSGVGAVWLYDHAGRELFNWRGGAGPRRIAGAWSPAPSERSR